jgi:hypothetical protein
LMRHSLPRSKAFRMRVAQVSIAIHSATCSYTKATAAGSEATSHASPKYRKQPHAQ